MAHRSGYGGMNMFRRLDLEHAASCTHSGLNIEDYFRLVYTTAYSLD